MAGKRAIVLVLVVLLSAVCPLFAADEGGSQSAEDRKEEVKVAADGVPYADKASYELMQQKPLTGNLVTNGSFEEGRYWPFGWDPVDRLGTFWVEGGTNGRRCVRLYTDLLDDQWVKWNERVLQSVEALSVKTKGRPQILPENPVKDPPPRTPTRPPYYDTVAGLHGIHYRSPMVKIVPGAVYRLSVDARTDAEGVPIVFTKGFLWYRVGNTEYWRNAGRSPRHLHGCGKEWKRFAHVFRPSKWKSTVEDKPVKPEVLQVQLYAYWKPGNYYFDNVRLDIVGYEKVEEEARPVQKPQPERKKESEPGEDGYPVFD